MYKIYDLVAGFFFMQKRITYHLTNNGYLGLKAGIFYWHFVDVVWLFLFVSIYYWG